MRKNLLLKLVNWSQGNNITMEIILPHTSIKNQGHTTHCWAYSMCSMIESELLSASNIEYTLNPLYFASHKRYPDRRGGVAQTFLDVYRNIDNQSNHNEWIKPEPTTQLPKAEDFIVLSSFSHAPYHKEITLKVPDNYEHFPSYNIPLNKMIEAVKDSIRNGHTCVWEGDIHGIGYSQQRGLALTLPSLFHHNSFMRSLAYFCHLLRDDHMMHIVGIGKNTKGTTFFLVKNSAGEGGAHKGYIYMSEDYFRNKTLTVTVRRNRM